MPSELNGRATTRAPREEIGMSQTQQLVRRPYPKNLEPFELTMTRPIDGLEMAGNFFGSSPASCVFRGVAVPVGTTQVFSLVQLGLCYGTSEVLESLSSRNLEAVEGVWAQVFYETFTVDVNGPVGIPDASWIFSHEAYFPIITKLGQRQFGLARKTRSQNWRWLARRRT